MKKFIFYITIFLTFTFTSISFAKSGKGELKFDKSTLEHFISYLYGAGGKNEKRRSEPLVYAVAENGEWAMYYFCPHVQGCIQDSLIQRQAEKGCEKNSQGSKCYTFAIKKG